MRPSVCAILLLGFVGLTLARVPFVGRFVSTERRENVQALAAATDNYDMGVSHRIFNEFLDKGNGDFIYKFSVEGSDYKQELPFRLGEEHQATYNGTSFKYKFVEEANELKFDSRLLPDGRHVTQTYTYDPHGFVKTYRVKDVTAKVWFKRNSS